MSDVLLPHRVSLHHVHLPSRLIPPAMAATYQTQSIFPDSYVGFDSITKQIEKKSVKRGFQFNVICVGKLQRCRMRCMANMKCQ